MTCAGRCRLRSTRRQMASFARCHWPSPWRAPTPKPNGGSASTLGALGLDRRAFLQSLCGAATTFLTLNEGFAALGNTGGQFPVPQEGAFELAAAAEAIAGDEFIFDVQTHM